MSEVFCRTYKKYQHLKNLKYVDSEPKQAFKGNVVQG